MISPKHFAWPVVKSLYRVNAGKGAPAGVVTIERNTLYELIDQKNPRNSLIEIKSDAPGLEAYAFTFG